MDDMLRRHVDRGKIGCHCWSKCGFMAVLLLKGCAIAHLGSVLSDVPNHFYYASTSRITVPQKGSSHRILSRNVPPFSEDVSMRFVDPPVLDGCLQTDEVSHDACASPRLH